MSNPRAILHQLHALGARVERREGRLVLCAGRRAVPEPLVEQARAAKAELLELLSADLPPKAAKAPTTTFDGLLREKTPKNASESRRNPEPIEGSQGLDSFAAPMASFDAFLPKMANPLPKEAKIPPKDAKLGLLRAGQHFCGFEPPLAPKESKESCRKEKWTPSVILAPFSTARQPETEGWVADASATSPALEEWHRGLALLRRDDPPRDLPAKRWAQFMRDARRLLDDGTLEEAAEIGWSALDLFGCDDRAPHGRIDMQGLVWLVGGNRVVSISSSAAVIEMRTTRKRQTYRRRLSDPWHVLPWTFPQVPAHRAR